MTQSYDANAVLMGGPGAKGWKFEDPGTTHTGTVAEPPKAVQEREYDPQNPGGGKPKFFPSGDPIMGVHVILQTNERDVTDEDDDGKRTFYVEGRYIKEAVRNAIRAAGSAGIEVGGQLTVTFTHREDPMDKRSRKYWDVKYIPAGNAALMAPETPAAATAPTPPPPAEPAEPAAPPADPAAAMAQIQTLIRSGLTDAQIAAALAAAGNSAIGIDAVAAVRSTLAAA